jgi:glucan biosynthesis protein
MKEEIKLKEYKFCSCQFVYNSKYKVLDIKFFKNGIYFFKSQVRMLTKKQKDHFISILSENNIKDLFIDNINIL